MNDTPDKAADCRPSPESCSAFVVETSDDGWATSEVYGVATTLTQAAMLGRELCFRWRVRHAKITIGGLLTDADLQNAEESFERLESIFDEPNAEDM